MCSPQVALRVAFSQWYKVPGSPTWYAFLLTATSRRDRSCRKRRTRQAQHHPHEGCNPETCWDKTWGDVYETRASFASDQKVCNCILCFQPPSAQLISLTLKRDSSSGNYALQDYQLQLMLLEQQNKKRLLMARQELDAMSPLSLIHI